MSVLDSPTRAAMEVAKAHGIVPDRCEILQNASTLVLRLTETLVARVVTDLEGPRQGSEWFVRENAVAQYLALHGAPVIPLHPEIPPGPHEHLGYTLNFWQFVSRIEAEPDPTETGISLFQCHRLLESFTEPLPKLAILTESLALLETHEEREVFSRRHLCMLRERLNASLEALKSFPSQALHGDAHLGNLMNTSQGLLWTDWEDTFLGPVEWDLASAIWNAKLIENDRHTVDEILRSYQKSGGLVDSEALRHSMIARAAVMCIWYPVLYPEPSMERRQKLQFRLDWLEHGSA